MDELSEEIRNLPRERRRAVESAAVVLVRALIGENPRTLQAFVASHRESPSTHRERNQARLELLSEEVRRQSLRGLELGRLTGLSRQHLQYLRRTGQLLGLQPPLRSEFWYPRWQFDAEGQVREVVPRLLAAAAEARLSPLGLHLLLTNPEAGVESQPLVDLLEEHPEEVLEIVAGAGDVGS